MEIGKKETKDELKMEKPMKHFKILGMHCSLQELRRTILSVLELVTVGYLGKHLFSLL